MSEIKVIELKVNNNLQDASNEVNQLKTNLKNASSEAKDFDKAIGTKKGASFNELKDSIGGLVPGFDKASTGASAFNRQLLLLVANPIGAVVAAVVLAVTGLVAIFRTFQPIVDKVEQSVAALGSVLDVIKNTFIAVFTGTKSLTQAFSGLGGEMSSAARRTMELVKAQQDLEDVLAQQEVQTSRTRAEINKLNVQAKNRALSEEERLKLLQRASALENQDFTQRRANADAEVRQAREAIAIKAGFSKAEIKLLKEQGLAAKELAESKGGNFDEEFKRLANAQKNRIGLEDESTANLEKNQNKQDALFDAQQAKRQKAVDDENARRNKRIEQEKADELALKTFNDDVLKNQQQMNVDKANKEIQDKLDAKINQEEKLQSISDEVDAIELLNQKQIDNATEAANKQIALDIAVRESKRNALETGLNILLQFAGKNKAVALGILAVQKGLAIADIVVNASKAIAVSNANLALIPAILPPGIPNPAFPFAVASNLKSILSTKISAATGIASILASGIGQASSITGGSNGGGGGAGTPPSSASNVNATTAAPNFNVVGASSTNQLAQTIGNQQNQPIKAYVVASDVTTQQGLDRNIIKSATIG